MDNNTSENTSENTGNLFTNTNYTLFMVVSSPTKLNVEGDNINNISNQAIDAGTFLQGSDVTPYGQLTVGFNSNSNLTFGHNLNDLAVPVSRSSDFRLMILRFSTVDGMKEFPPSTRGSFSSGIRF